MNNIISSIKSFFSPIIRFCLLLVILCLFAGIIIFSFGFTNMPFIHAQNFMGGKGINQNNQQMTIQNKGPLLGYERLFEYLPFIGNPGYLEKMVLSSYFRAIEAYEYQQFLQKKVVANKRYLIPAKPEYAGLSSVKLAAIDSIVLDAIQQGATPGSQIFIAKNGLIVYDKAFGFHDYSQVNPVKPDDLYDVASITKIAATTLAAMKLTQQKALQLDATLGSYFTDTRIHYINLPEDIANDTVYPDVSGKSKTEIEYLAANRNYYFVNDTTLAVENVVVTRRFPESNIFQITISDLLTHQSGIDPSPPMIPYLYYADTYREILQYYPTPQLLASRNQESFQETHYDQDDLLLHDVQEIDRLPEDEISFYFTRQEAFDYFFSETIVDGLAEISITENMFLKNHFRDSIFQAMKRLSVKSSTQYQYTDMNMILLQMVLDSITKTDLDTYMKKEFYEPLGMKNTTFNPLRYFSKEKIIPTEEEKFWRNQLIHGTVHDPLAAVMGGIAGNAGLFSTASDLGILGQMLLQGGSYNDNQYLGREVVDTFTVSQPSLRRGLGFNKPIAGGVHAPDAHHSSYGHTGFTGTAMWIDPENEIVFVFLSNRITPRADNNLLSEMKVREKVHQAIYDAMIP